MNDEDNVGTHFPQSLIGYVTNSSKMISLGGQASE